MKTIIPTSVLVLLLLPVSAFGVRVSDSASEWVRFTTELADAGLPTRFISVLPAGFVQLEFADLKTVAAEYHPAGHQMVFNLALSEHHEGLRFRPIRDISNHELSIIYHELFHAYFDYLDFAAQSPRMPASGTRLLTQAKGMLACRYTVVDVLAGPSRKARPRRVPTEHRRLSESEGWDALNETWGVFIGWAIWNKLELTDRYQINWEWDTVELFWNRLLEAHEEGILTGYFETGDGKARHVVSRLYLAPTSAISLAETALLLENILEESPRMVDLAFRWIALDHSVLPAHQSCES